MQEPQCRFCLESKADALNPFISPCPCKGSVKYIHQLCLYRWVYMDHEDLKLSCSICKTPFFKDYLPLLEIIPKRGTVADFLLESPLFTLFICHYFTIFLSAFLVDPGNLTTGHMYFSQLLLHTIYFIGFAMNVRVNNTSEYIRESCFKYANTLCGHCMAVYMMLHGYPFLTIPVAASLTIYWHTHKTTLQTLNKMLMDRHRYG